MRHRGGGWEERGEWETRRNTLSDIVVTILMSHSQRSLSWVFSQVSGVFF